MEFADGDGEGEGVGEVDTEGEEEVISGASVTGGWVACSC